MAVSHGRCTSGLWGLAGEGAGGSRPDGKEGLLLGGHFNLYQTWGWTSAFTNCANPVASRAGWPWPWVHLVMGPPNPSYPHVP